MNRRAFLSTLATVMAGATLDPERLLWRPGAKTIFLPPVRVYDPTVGIAMRFIGVGEYGWLKCVPWHVDVTVGWQKPTWAGRIHG